MPKGGYGVTKGAVYNEERRMPLNTTRVISDDIEKKGDRKFWGTNIRLEPEPGVKGPLLKKNQRGSGMGVGRVSSIGRIRRTDCETCG